MLRTLLEEERRLIARGGSSRVAISSENYTFINDGIDANGLVRVTLRPLRKERPLIVGPRASIARVDGTTSPAWPFNAVDDLPVLGD